MIQRPMLLLIRGLGHSGTTILDLALGAHPQIVGLGEAARILERPKAGEESRGPAMLRGPYRKERRCTCGALAADCPVWGSILQDLEANDDQALTDKMRSLLERVVHHRMEQGHGVDVVVDSFQDDLVLPMQLPPDVDVRIIHLVRDVRSWLHSRLRAKRQVHRFCSDARTLARWWYVNWKFERVLKRSGRPVFRLGYEELALRPEEALQHLCDWLGVPFDPSMLKPGFNSQSHILSGNRMRFDVQKSSVIIYDDSWLRSTHWMVRLAPLIPVIAAMNYRLVYSNTSSVVRND
jgi:hypothetical protein